MLRHCVPLNTCFIMPKGNHTKVSLKKIFDINLHLGVPTLNALVAVDNVHILHLTSVIAVMWTDPTVHFLWRMAKAPAKVEVRQRDVLIGTLVSLGLVVAFSLVLGLGKRDMKILFQSKGKKLLILTSSWSSGFATKGLGRCSLPS